MGIDYEMFGEDVDFDEALSMIRFDDFEDADNVEDELNYNSGWYNYSVLSFDYNENRYSIEYKEHTSDNVSDFEWLTDTFVCLGNVSDLKKKISGKDLALMKIDYERRIESLEKDVERYRNTVDLLDSVTPAELQRLGNMLSDVHEEGVGKNHPDMKINVVGKFLKQLSKVKRD